MLSSDWAPRVIPFSIYILFIALQSLISYLAPYLNFFTLLNEYANYVFYPVKIILIVFTIIYFWQKYNELTFKIRFHDLLFSISAGVVVFYLWIHMDWPFAMLGKPEPFNPYIFQNSIVILLIVIRLFGASVVVPIMEELFWRSFVIRYIINTRFQAVPVGTFTWLSFLVTVLLFGAEHTLLLAGVMAGVLYNLVLYRTKSIACCIISHGVTNFLLGIYVIKTGSWHFW